MSSLLLLYTFSVLVLEPMLVKTVSKKIVSCENSKFPVLGTVSKSFLQELHKTMLKTKANPYKYLNGICFLISVKI